MNNAAEPTPRLFAFGPFVFMPEQQLLMENEAPITLGGRALDILTALVERAGDVVTKRELIARAWPNSIVEEGNLKVNIAALRRALGDKDGVLRYIATVTGRGYRFIAPVRFAVSETEGGSQVACGSKATNLPSAVTNIVGRSETIAEIYQALEIDRALTIVGAGGIGKTTVALAIAERAAARVRDGAWFVDLSQLTRPDQVVDAIAQSVGAPEGSAGLSDLLGYLRDRQMLLVLDNCEHLIEAVASCARSILAHAPSVRLLATSREPLRIKGEQVYRLPPLKTPPIASSSLASTVMAFPAAQLFVECAQARNRSFRLVDEDAPVVAELCQRLDGLALAIELAATRADAFGVRNLLGLLDGRFGLLSGLRSGPQRHLTMTATIDWSFNLLSPDERALLVRLSVFPGAFRLEAACVIAGADCDLGKTVDDLANLVDKSLVIAELQGADIAYRLLDTTRAYALRRLAESGEEEIVRQRYARFMSEQAKAVVDEQTTRTPRTAWPALAVTTNTAALHRDEFDAMPQPRSAFA